MPVVPTFALDHWLVISADAYGSLSGFWRTEAGTGSLLDWRLTQDLVAFVAPESLEARIGALAAAPDPSITVVVDAVDPALVERLDALPDGAGIHLVEWRASPLDVVLAMNAPDAALLANLRDGGESGHPPPTTAQPMTDPDGYVAALMRWEQACRTGDSAAFSEAYPAMADIAIPWWRLIAGEEAASAAAPAAANDNWIALDMLAAATPTDAGRPVTVDDPRNTPAQWKLTVSPIDGGPETLVIFRASPAAALAFVGCRVRLRTAHGVIELGEVDDEGRAETLLPNPVDMKGLSISWTEGA